MRKRIASIALSVLIVALSGCDMDISSIATDIKDTVVEDVKENVSSLNQQSTDNTSEVEEETVTKITYPDQHLFQVCQFKDELSDYECGVVNEKGETIIEMGTYEIRDAFGINHYAPIYDRETKTYGYVDTLGNIVIDFQFEEAGPYYKDTALVMKDGKYGYIDSTGKILLDYSYEAGLTEVEDKYIVKKDGYYGVLNLDGEVLFDFIYDSIGYLNIDHNLYGVIDEVYYYLLLENEVAYSRPIEYQVIPINNDYFYYYVNVDDKGKKTYALAAETFTLTEFSYTAFVPVEGNDYYMLVQEDGMWNFIDATGKKLFEQSFFGARPFANGYAPVVMLNEDSVLQWGYVNIHGRIVIPALFTKAGEMLDNELAQVKWNGVETFISVSYGEHYLPYQSVSSYVDGYSVVKTAKGYGNIDVENNEIIAPEYLFVTRLFE